MLGIILLIMSAEFYIILSNSIHRDEQYRLQTAGQKLANNWMNLSTSHLIPEPNEREKPHRHMEWEYLQSNQFALIANPSWTVAALPPLLENPLLTSRVQKQLDACSSSYCYVTDNHDGKDAVYAVLRIAVTDTGGNTVFVGEDVTNQRHLLFEMKWLLTGCSILLILIAAILGYLFAGRAMIPINRTFQRQQKFTADASHELRTPLSVLQSSVEILEEQQHLLPSVDQTILQHMKDEIQRMTRLTGQLLLLARSDSPSPSRTSEPVDLRQLLHAAVERMGLSAQYEACDHPSRGDGITCWR